MAVIAIDFDGTCVTHKYPKVGRDVPDAVRIIKRLSDEGHKLILWTMRSDQQLKEAVEWFIYNGITLYAVNKNPGQVSWTSSPKAYANLYIDDAALGCPLALDDLDVPNRCERPYVDWEAVEIELELLGYLKKTYYTEESLFGI